jgi:hypothetical protein
LINTKSKNGHLSSRELRLERPDEKDSNVIDIKKDDGEFYENVDPESLWSCECLVRSATTQYIDHSNAGRRQPAIILRLILGTNMNNAFS